MRLVRSYERSWSAAVLMLEDAFNGAFAVGLMLGRSPLESAQFAAAAGAVSVTRAGAQPSMPTIEEVNLMLARSARAD